MEVERYDELMRIAKAAGQATLKNAILAFLIAHGGGTKTLITGFLQVSDFREATVSSVGEALSRLRDEGIIYRLPAAFTFTYYPLTYGRKLRVSTSEVMGEPVYGISHATRLRILERLKFEPYLAWWGTEMLKPPPTFPVKRPVEYEWVRTIKPTPSFRSAEDFKHYGPYKTGDLAKLPLTFAYFLVRTGYAEWLNPRKENVVEAEKIFRYQPIERIRRQATLI
jgi:DNA-binding transcriptional ArsR family regulator